MNETVHDGTTGNNLTSLPGGSQGMLMGDRAANSHHR
jgi:hypothetical protein